MTENRVSSWKAISIFDAVINPELATTKRDVILSAATRVFLRNGYSGSSMDLVATEAKVARRTLYNQFPEGKEALFRSVIERVWSAFPINDIVAKAETVSDPEVGLKHIATAVAEFWQPQPAIDFFRMIIAEGSRFPDLVQSFFDNGKTPAMNAIRSYLEKLHELKKLNIVDSERATRQFLGLIDEPLLWIRIIGRHEVFSPAQRKKVVDEAVEIFLGYYGIPSH